ncbi:MAG TPA: hypothetical protein VF719_00960, partial [Abditibacteriaceae bacterium]
MKNRMLHIVGCLILPVVVAMVPSCVPSKPDDPVLGISQSSMQGYEEMVMLKRDRTYEQMLRKKSDGSIIIQKGGWSPSKEDTNSQLFAGQTNTRPTDDYITYKDKLSPNLKSGEYLKVDISMEPARGLLPSTDKIST